MQDDLDILRDVTRRLSEAGIEYMLTGSYALNYYAEPRMTRDIDLVVALTPKDAESIIALFEDDYYVPRNAVAQGITNQTLFNLIHNEGILKVDFIIRKNTEYRRLEFERRQEVAVEDVKLWIVSKEDLIVSKLLWAKDSHSEFQLRDVKNLLKSGYDAGYLETWARKLDLDELLRECLDE
jgi:predicted nucleotidyltransferase